MRKDIAQSILAQTFANIYGTSEYFTTSFMNIVITDADGSEKNLEPPSNLRLRMTNEPVMEYREEGRGDDRKRVPIKPCILNLDELVRIQLGIERKEHGGSRRQNLAAEDLAQLEYLESLRVLEYAASIEVAYGKDDFITAEEASDAPELNYVGPEIERLIKNGMMDILIADPKRIDAQGNQKPMKVNRPHTYTLNLWDLRRIVAKNTVPASIPERLGGPGSRFFLLTGTSSQALGMMAGVFPTHVIVGRMPDEGARPRRTDYRPGGKLGQGKRGQPRRGWVMALKIENVRHGNATYQGLLVPSNKDDMTPHMRWLMDHPTSDDHDVIMFLNQAIAEAETREAAAAARAEETEPAKAEGAAEAPQPEPEAEAKVAEAEASPAETQGEAPAEPEKAAEAAPDAVSDQPRETLPVGDDELIPKAEGTAEAPQPEPEAEAKVAEADASPAETQGEAPMAVPGPANSEPDISSILAN